MDELMKLRDHLEKEITSLEKQRLQHLHIAAQAEGAVLEARSILAKLPQPQVAEPLANGQAAHNRLPELTRPKEIRCD